MSDGDRSTYMITLTASAGTVPAVVRLRSLLKLALRRFGFRVVEVRERNRQHLGEHE